MQAAGSSNGPNVMSGRAAIAPRPPKLPPRPAFPYFASMRADFAVTAILAALLLGTALDRTLLSALIRVTQPQQATQRASTEARPQGQQDYGAMRQ